tara:strand:+ start:498 stop:1208 length:711 start_codon:yes stop_codon:yes gene_type:complete
MARRKKQYIDFTSAGSGIVASLAGIGGAAAGSTGNENILKFSNNETLYHHVLGTQTILIPAVTADGLNIGQDQTDDDGCEISGCPVTGTGGIQFVVGTDPAFYFACTVTVPDVSATDDFAIGFRKAETYQAAVDGYDEMAAFNIISGDIKTETILNNAATVTTDTTDNWTDGQSKTLKVLVSAAGVVTYQVDGSAPTTTAAFTFDDAEVVIPFVYMLNTSDLVGALTITAWDVGYQ